MTRSRKPNVEMAMPAAMKVPPAGPSSARMVSAAGAVLCGQPRGPEHAEVGQIGEQVDRDHDQHAAHQRARQGALGLDDLLGDEVGLLPPAVGEEHRHERGAGGEQPVARGHRRGGQRGAPASPGSARARPADDQRHEGAELEHREHVHGDRTGLDADVVDAGQQDDRGDRDRHRQAMREPGERERVIGEGDGHGGDGAGGDDEEQRPAVQERGQRPPGLSQVYVAAAGARAPLAELAVAEGADEARSRRRAPTSASASAGEPTRPATAAGVRKIPPPMMPPTTAIVAEKRPSRRA